MLELQPAEAAGFTKRSVHEYGGYIASELGLEPAGDLYPIIRDLGGEVVAVSGPDWEDTSGSIVVNGPNDFKIYLSAYTGLTRDRFTIAHELGHYFLHSRQGEKKVYAERYTPGTSDRVEWEANWFAAGFLMPQEKVIDAWKEFSVHEYVASVFGVSIDAAKFRINYLKELGLV